MSTPNHRLVLDLLALALVFIATVHVGDQTLQVVGFFSEFEITSSVDEPIQPIGAAVVNQGALAAVPARAAATELPRVSASAVGPRLETPEARSVSTAETPFLAAPTRRSAPRRIEIAAQLAVDDRCRPASISAAVSSDGTTRNPLAMLTPPHQRM